MTILLRWLIDNIWILYAACALCAMFFVWRALRAQKQRDLAQFTLERETAHARVVQAWAMALLFTIIGAVAFVGTTFMPPDLLPDISNVTPTPASGVAPLTPNATAPTPSPTAGFVVPTLTPTSNVPTPPQPTIEPTPEETTPAGVSAEMRARFGDYAELVSFNIPAAEITTAEPLILTLRWQALPGSSPLDYQVFTHLISEEEGELIAQHDGLPAEGGRPMSTWESGEIIIDVHPMTFYQPDFTGAARIEVGLWDPGTGRATIDTGSDHVTLTTINVVPQP